MKKVIFSLIALLSMSLAFTSCSNDDDDTVNVTQTEICGLWGLTSYDGHAVSSDDYYAYFKSNGYYAINFGYKSYVGTYKMNGNTIVGTTLDPVTEYFKITSKSGNKMNISYSNSWGYKHTMTVVKEAEERN